MFSLSTLMVSLFVCIFIVSVLVLAKAFPSRKRIEIRWLLFFTATVCLISFCSLNVYVQGSLQGKETFSRFRYLGFSLVGQTWFFFLYYTYGERGFFHKTWVKVASLAPAVVTWALVLVPRWNTLFTKNYRVFSWHGVALVTFQGGPWWRAHLTWSYIFVWLGILYALYMIPRVDTEKKKQLAILSLGGVVAILVDFFSLNYFIEFRWAMLSSGATLITESAILYGIVKHDLLDLSLIAKNQIFREIPDPVLILDMNRRLLDFNVSAATLFELTKENLDMPLDTNQSLKNFTLDNATQEWTLANENIGRRCFHLTKEPLKKSSFINGEIWLFHEITAQKEVETKLSNNLEFKARLLSMIAHDFSDALQTQNHLSMNLLNLGKDAELQKYASTLAESTSASQDFMTSILLWARSQENRFQPIVHPYEMNVLLREVASSLESIWKLRDLQVEIHSNHDPLILNGDSVMIESVVRNLLTNAIRASQPGQEIDLRIESGSKEVKVQVQDEGVGMSPKQLEVIRQNSEAAFSNASLRPSGFGLGLAIARRFVDLHNGRLDFFSEEGKGTLVTMTLPL